MNYSDTFYILALDGGGTRGIYTAQFLKQVEQLYDVRISDCFDLIVGTSIGAIIAGAAVTNIPMDEIVELFDTEANEIFRKKWYRNQLIFSKYSIDRLAHIVAKHIPAIPLSQISKPVMITCSEITKSDLHIFRSNYMENHNQSGDSEGDVCLREAIVASCAAPTFFAPKYINNHSLADGGLWANNPSIAAYAESITNFEKEPSQIKIMSIGTGHSTGMYGKKRRWGFLSGWGGVKLISYVMTLQSHTSATIAKLLLQENYFRVDPTIDFWDLDTDVYLDDLKSMAIRDFAENSNDISGFIRPSVLSQP